MLRVLVDMIVEDDFIMGVVDTVQELVDSVVRESDAEDHEPSLINRMVPKQDWVDPEGNVLIPVDFDKTTYHDRCLDIAKVVAGGTGFIQHADKMACFRSDKSRTKSWSHAYQTLVRRVIPISEKPVSKSMLRSSDIKARKWDGWETAPDTLDFYANLNRIGLKLRKKSMIARRLFQFNRTHMASYNPTDVNKPYLELGDYVGADPSIAIQAVPGFYKLPQHEQEYIQSEPFLKRVVHEMEQHGELRDEFFRDDPGLTSDAAKVCVYVHIL